MVQHVLPEIKDDKSQFDADSLGTVEKDMRRIIHRTIKRVGDDIKKRFNFNTAVSAIMELTNALYHYTERTNKVNGVLREGVSTLIILLAPFTPHLAEELWDAIGGEGSVHDQKWPEVDQDALKEDELSIAVQINGKVRDHVKISVGLKGKDMEKVALAQPRVKELIEGKELMRVICVPDKLVNLVVRESKTKKAK